MRTLKKHQSLEEQMHFVCDKCYHQFACDEPAQAEELTRQIEAIKRVYDQKLITEEVYHELLKVLISAYIGNRIATTTNHKLRSILNDKLSPYRILESLALAP